MRCGRRQNGIGVDLGERRAALAKQILRQLWAGRRWDGKVHLAEMLNINALLLQDLQQLIAAPHIDADLLCLLHSVKQAPGLTG